MAQRLKLEDLERFTGIPQGQFEEYISAGKLKATKKNEVKPEDMFSLKDDLLANARPLLEKGLGSYPDDNFALRRSEDLYKAANSYGFAGDDQTENKVRALADLARFTKTNAVMSAKAETQWGRFSPVMTWELEDGSTKAMPDPRAITEADVEAVATYKELTADLELQTMCADFLFERKWGKGRERMNNFRFAIQGFLNLAVIYLERGQEWRHRLVDALARSMQLAEGTKQQDLALASKQLHLDTIQVLLKTKDFRYIIEIAESLHLQSKTLSDNERNSVLDALTLAAEYYASREGENRHLERGFLLLKKDVIDEAQKKAVSSEIVDSYVKEAKEPNAKGMVKLSLIESALKELRAAGLDGGDAERELNIKLSEGTKEAVASMEPISVEVKIPTEDFDQMVKGSIGENPEEYLKVLSVSPLLVPSWAQAEKHYTDGSEYSTLSRLFNTTLFSAEEKFAEIEGGMEATPERITRAYLELIDFMGFVRVEAFGRLKKEGIEADAILEHLKTSSIFRDYPHVNAVAAGIRQYEAGDYFTATTILSIQLEGLLRFICEKTGKPTVRGLKTDGTGGHDQIMFFGLLASLKESISENLHWYIRITCCDPYGMRIRNEAAHARLSFEGQQNHAQIILHILLLLSSYKSLPLTEYSAD